MAGKKERGNLALEILQIILVALGLWQLWTANTALTTENLLCEVTGQTEAFVTPDLTMAMWIIAIAGLVSFIDVIYQKYVK